MTAVRMPPRNPAPSPNADIVTAQEQADGSFRILRMQGMRIVCELESNVSENAMRARKLRWADELRVEARFANLPVGAVFDPVSPAEGHPPT